MGFQRKGIKMKFAEFYKIQENSDTLDQPHVVSADPPIKLPKSLTKLVEAFKESKTVPIAKEVDPKNGGEKHVTLRSKKLYLVGGAVRDYLLKRTPSNYNLVTDAHPDEVEKICRHGKVKVVDSSEKNGSVTVESGGETYEIKTMKGESGFTTDIAEDSKTRDLTINAIYYDLTNDKISDFVGGIQDLKGGKIKFIGKATDRIKKDPKLVSRYERMKNLIPDAKTDEETDELVRGHNDDDFDHDHSREEFWKGLGNLHSDPHSYVKSWNKDNMLGKIFKGMKLSDDLPDCPTNKSRAIVMASVLKNNDPHEIFNSRDKIGMSDRDARDVVFLINLPKMNPTNIDEFKNKMLRTGLTFRQIRDWAKVHGIDAEKLF